MLLRVFLMLSQIIPKCFIASVMAYFSQIKTENAIRRILRMLFFHGMPEMKTDGLGFRGTIRLIQTIAGYYTVSGRGLDNKTTHSQCFVRANMSTACTFWAV